MIARTGLLGLLMTLAAVAPAAALPAQVYLVVDSSASMGKPAPGGGGTRLDVAKKIANQLLDALGNRHRVGLVRFAQRDVEASTGRGTAMVHGTDPKACERGSDLLVPPSANNGQQLRQWLDGQDSAGNREIVALGDSPLLRTLQTLFSFIRLKRKLDPAHQCVNQVVVVLTDAQDGCEGAGSVAAGLAALSQQGNAEAIRTLVLTFDPDTDTAKALAKIGVGSAPGTVYTPQTAAAMVAAAAALEGKPAPEACLISGADPQKVWLKPPTTAALGDDVPCGCSAGCPAERSAWWPAWALAATLAAVALRRRWAAIAALVWIVGGCAPAGPGPAAGADAAAGDVAAGGGISAVEDPASAQAASAKRVAALTTAAEKIRAELTQPALDPAQVFAAVGDAKGCLQLALSKPYEPYKGAQRGVRGCLAATRCNDIDKALLLQACLATKGTKASLHRCPSTPEQATALLTLAQTPAQLTPPGKLAERLHGALAAVDGADGAIGKARQKAAADIGAALGAHVAKVVQADLDGLKPLIAVAPVASAQKAKAAVDAVADAHAVALVDGQAQDPVLQGALASNADCKDGSALGPADVDVTVNVQLSAVYAWSEDTTTLTRAAPVVLGKFAYAAAEAVGKILTVAIVDPAFAPSDQRLPTPSQAGCLQVRLGLGESLQSGPTFPIAQADAAGCALPEAAAYKAGWHLARLDADVTVHVPGAPDVVLHRALADRYSYGHTSQGRALGGPSFDNTTARTLLPVRVEVPIISGIPTPTALADMVLADAAAAAVRVQQASDAKHGAPAATPTAATGRPGPFLGALLGIVANHAGQFLGPKAALISERPWFVGHLARVGLSATAGGVAFAEQHMVDVMDAPLLVAGGDDTARLQAQLAMGALVTEAERIAATSIGDTPAVVNAAAMFRAAKPGSWGQFGDAGFAATLFPTSVAEAAGAFMGDGYTLVVTKGAQNFLGDDYIAWWRVDQATGWTLGEVRYDGTFFGQAVYSALGGAGVQFIADADRCLWAAASDALAGQATSEAQIKCCLQAAAKAALKSAATGALKGATFDAAGSIDLSNFTLGLWLDGVDIATVVNWLDSTASFLDSAAGNTDPSAACIDKAP